ncbi:MAG: DNA topoisomerase III, partial [Pseudomonadota bacterium]
MKLYIAEKPSLGRAIADVLPKPHQRHDGYIVTGNGDRVSWCIGHLLEQAEPHKYNAEFKSWRMQHLPIVPEQWKLVPKTQTKNQLNVLKKLVGEADHLVHAGDPDREGQLLVDQLFSYLKVGKQKRARIERVLINDLNPQAVKRALAAVQRNTDFVTLSSSALARSRADWLYGINMTRAYTIQGRKTGYDGVLSVGRDQTPVLGLVVRRCEEIENFVSKPFYEVLAHLQTEKLEHCTATWQPSEACEPYMDDSGRVLHKALAENVVKRISGQPAVVTRVSSKNKKLRQPLPYNLSALQIDASRRFGLSAQQTLSVCQSLYERHKLITYPRSDCRYLPVEQFQQRGDVLAAIRNNETRLSKALGGADTQIKSPAWNDKKVGAHHAIIPAARQLKGNSLSDHEKKIYALVATQYIAQFYPVHEYIDTRVEVTIAGGLFVATWKKVVVQGWKVLFEKHDKKDNNAEPATPPSLAKGQALHCEKGELIEKNTTPPAYFTDATLLAAMTGIARYVKDDSIRKILRDTDGLGTEATRAGIIELLIKRGLMQRKGKQIHDMPAGRALVKTLPGEAVVPDMTAQWESMLDRISRADMSYHDFMQPLENQLQRLIDESASCEISALKGVKALGSKSSNRKKFKRRSSKKKSRKKSIGTKR